VRLIKFARIFVVAMLAVIGAQALTAQSFKPMFMTPSQLPPKKFAPVLGVKMAYYDVGKGPVLVLVHGFGSEALFDWGSVILPLAKTHRVLAIDEIGWGSSDKPQIDYSIQTFVDFLGEFLRTQHIDHFALAGESLGGWIVANYTIQALAPSNTGKYAIPKPDKLILEDAAGHNAIHVNGPAQVSGTLADAAGIKMIFYHKDWITPELVHAAFALKLKANDGFTQRSVRTNAKMDSETVVGKLDGITIPTLVVWGGNDGVVPIADGKDYAAKIPNAKLVVVPECGHVASMEQPKAFLAAVSEFLK
jgi:pimeloyl-ACP methyl ester carboxylesterase